MLVADSWLGLFTCHLIQKSSSFLGPGILGRGKGKSGQKHTMAFTASAQIRHMPHLLIFRITLNRIAWIPVWMCWGPGWAQVGLGYEDKGSACREGGREEGSCIDWQYCAVISGELLTQFTQRFSSPDEQKLHSILNWIQWNYWFSF